MASDGAYIDASGAPLPTRGIEVIRQGPIHSPMDAFPIWFGEGRPGVLVDPGGQAALVCLGNPLEKNGFVTTLDVGPHSRILVADLDADGRSDVFAIDYPPERAKVFRGTDLCRFSAAGSFAIPRVGPYGGPVLTDLNRDGLVDVVLPVLSGDNAKTALFATMIGGRGLRFDDIRFEYAPDRVAAADDLYSDDLDADGVNDVLIIYNVPGQEDFDLIDARIAANGNWTRAWQFALPPRIWVRKIFGVTSPDGTHRIVALTTDPGGQDSRIYVLSPADGIAVDELRLSPAIHASRAWPADFSGDGVTDFLVEDQSHTARILEISLTGVLERKLDCSGAGVYPWLALDCDLDGISDVFGDTWYGATRETVLLHMEGVVRSVDQCELLD